MSRGSSVSVVDDRVRFPAGGRYFFSSPPRPDRACDPPNLLFNGYEGFCPGVSILGVKLTTQFYLVPSLACVVPN